MQVLPVLEAPASQKDRKVPRRVAAGIAEIAPEKNSSAVQEVGIAFLRPAKLDEQVAHGLHGLDFDDLELREFARILAVVRKIMVAEIDAFDRWCRGGTGEHDGDQPCRVGLQGQMCEVE